MGKTYEKSAMTRKELRTACSVSCGQVDSCGRLVKFD